MELGLSGWTPPKANYGQARKQWEVRGKQHQALSSCGDPHPACMFVQDTHICIHTPLTLVPVTLTLRMPVP